MPGELVNEGEEFTCIDCGLEVYRPFPIAANDQHLCLECAWLRGIEDPQERERLRAFLQSSAPPIR